MLELRFPPAHRADDEHLARVRRIVAQALDIQKRQGNRAGNQKIIDDIGVDVRSERDEAYCGEALDYHLGLLYAHVGDPERAAHHFELSGTHPGWGGNKVFSDHQRDSIELRARQQLAMERGIPSLFIASMPRSASASLTQTLAAALDAPIMRVSSGRYPNFYLVPRWLNSFSRGGAVLHDHFGALPFNLKTLREGGVREVFVRVRDPRAAAASAAHLSNRKFGVNDDADYEAQVIWLCEQCFIPWLATWMTVVSDAKTGLRIHLLAQPSSSIRDAAREILSTLSSEYPLLEQYLRTEFPAVTANFVTNEDEGWRKGISERGQERLWQATPVPVRELLGLRP